MFVPCLQQLLLERCYFIIQSFLSSIGALIFVFYFFLQHPDLIDVYVQLILKLHVLML